MAVQKVRNPLARAQDPMGRSGGNTLLILTSLVAEGATRSY